MADPHTLPVLALWLDDELHDSGRQNALTPWHAPMLAIERFGKLKLETCSRLAPFADALRQGVRRGNRDPEPIELLIIDLMLDFEDPHFGPLGFERELFDYQSAGAQIAGLIRSSRFDASRPEWLKPYCEVPMLLLSSSPKLHEDVPNQVGERRMGGIVLVNKSLQTYTSSGESEPSPEFTAAMESLLALAEARRP